ncbi:unnamed protein product [Eruca vesicaria subsp. sativa]|uniref:DUF577 domain-containing protein n=1 Tax=Eruca vesicaria subsp. sativa TaxID=29727 RepID=A0ABC8K3H0_ERUVS|nr:unnamed protein product [Eruca vesicaria subsp. sativa]
MRKPTYQGSFVSEFAYKIAGIGTDIREAARKIYQIVTKRENQRFYFDLYNNLKTLSAMGILQMWEDSRKIKKLLMSCLNEVGVPENTFKLLGKVVFHVALELLCYQEYNVAGSAFVGAFCVAIHLLERTRYTESVKEVLDEMVSLVRDPVGRGMKVRLVRRDFRDLERIMKKLVDWYDANEY